MRPDFHVIGPARPADPHIELEFLNHTLYPEFSIYSGERWGEGPDSRLSAPFPPTFRGTRDAAFLPDIICNDHGLPLWKPALVARVLAVERFIPLLLVDAAITVRGGRRPLPEGAKIVVPAVGYGPEVIDWGETARRHPFWQEDRNRHGLRPPEIILREDFRPAAPLFRLSFLNREQIVLNDRLAAAICGPEAEVPLRHCHVARLSGIGYDQPANVGPTPAGRYAALLEDHLQAAKPGPRKAAAPEPAPPRAPDEAGPQAEVLAMFADIRQQPLSGNRESWSELVQVGADYYLRSGQTDSAEVHTRRLSDTEAWHRLRERAMEGLGLYTFREQAGARPETIRDYYRSIWHRPLPAAKSGAGPATGSGE
jgi:hypothetical protein